MLVLSRKKGEAIIIGNGENRVVVHVVKIQSNRVQLGVEAPREMPILREEIEPHKRSEAEKKCYQCGKSITIGDFCDSTCEEMWNNDA